MKKQQKSKENLKQRLVRLEFSRLVADLNEKSEKTPDDYKEECEVSS